MRKLRVWLLLLLLGIVGHLAAADITGKQIYIPKELQDNDFNDDSSTWSYARSRLTPNFVIFWEKGFGDDVSSPPDLEGHRMSFDLDNLCERLESFYAYYYHTLGFARPGSLCDKYRMMVIVSYSLEGTAYGGDYDGVIGALWVAPNRIQDRTLNCIAHELGHCFQSQIMCDGEGEAWGGSGFFEMTSQWMLWQVNPNWIGSETYHWDAFCQHTHHAYLSFENIYRSPYIIEYWGMKRGLTSIADLYRAGKRGEDPVITYKCLYGLSQATFVDEMYEATARIVNLDYPRCWELTRPYACRMATPVDTLSSGWLRPDSAFLPENYGFNVFPIDLKAHRGRRISVSFRGDDTNALYRYGFVAIDADGNTSYSHATPSDRTMERRAKGTIHFRATRSTQKLFFVVLAAPWEHPTPQRHMHQLEMTDAPVPTIPTDRERPLPRPDATYGYSFRIR